jgi:hypothetical protein
MKDKSLEEFDKETYPQALREYEEALERMEQSVKLTAWHTNECAKETRKTALYSKETVDLINQGLEDAKAGRIKRINLNEL